MHYAPIVSLHGTPTTIKNGLSGIFQTIAIMRNIVNAYKINPDVRQAAVSIVFLTPEKDTHAELTALFNFVRDRIRYLRDINNVETIATPDKTLLTRIGDCDDQSVLLASLCESIGYQTRFIVAGYSDVNVLEHVYVQVLSDAGWLDCDPTEHNAIGWAPPDAVIIYQENI